MDGTKIVKDKKPEDPEYVLYNGKCTCEKENLNVKNIVVFGQTGSGKTTLLDSYTNYLMGVDFYDKFRYRLVDER